MALQHVDVREIGRKLFGSEVQPFLCTGTTIADFQLCGRTPSLKEESNI
jgi:hypothetical protein